MSSWGPIRVAMGEPISAVILRPTRKATGRSISGVIRLVIAAAVRSVVREVVCRATCAASPVGLQAEWVGVTFREPFPISV